MLKRLAPTATPAEDSQVPLTERNIFSKKYVDFSRTMPFCSKDPCGGLEPEN